MEKINLSEKIAVVTGGSRGIGRAVCLRLASMGAEVVVNYVSRPDAAEKTVDAVKAKGGKAHAVRFDIGAASEVRDGFKKIIADLGKIDILVNNAGITRDALVATMKEDDWDTVLGINLKGAYNCIKASCRPMMKQRWGRIITITSVVGFTGNAGQANYAAAKAGLVALTKSVARELASRGVTANGVAPGYIETDMTNGLNEKIRDKILSEIPMGVLGTVDDVAGAVAFLCSEEARYITGQVIHVNGGMLMA